MLQNQCQIISIFQNAKTPKHALHVNAKPEYPPPPPNSKSCVNPCYVLVCSRMQYDYELDFTFFCRSLHTTARKVSKLRKFSLSSRTSMLEAIERKLFTVSGVTFIFFLLLLLLLY